LNIIDGVINKSITSQHSNKNHRGPSFLLVFTMLHKNNVIIKTYDLL